MKFSGAQAMVLALEKENIDRIFGYPGVAICPFYHCLSCSSIEHVLVRHEQNAGHAAAGYARLSGRPGVCVTTSGPGALNLITAIATAYSDSIPLVAITGQVPRSQVGHDVFQEADIMGACEGFTKYSYQVRSAKDIPQTFAEAFYLASSGRPGPVLIDVPQDVQQELFDSKGNTEINLPGYKPTIKGNKLQIKRIISAVENSQRPLLCAGGGVISAGAGPFMQQFCEGAGIPVITTLMGVDSLPHNHPLNMGMVGSFGSNRANRALEQCDLLIIAGARVGDRAVTPWKLGCSTVVHIDIDPAEIGKIIDTQIPIVGDAANIFGQLIGFPLKYANETWVKYLCESLSVDYRDCIVTEVVKALCSFLPNPSVITADVGLLQTIVYSSYESANGRRLLTSGGMGTMGYALPAAVGACFACADGSVVALMGDGSFQMSMNELATVCENHLPLKVIVMNNGCLGLVKKVQEEQFGGNTFATALRCAPSLSMLAGAYGLPYIKLSAKGNAAKAVKELLATEGACIMEVEVAQ